MKIACCQLDIVWENKPANYQKVRGLLQEAGLPRGSMAVLPEMFSTGFSMNVAGIQEHESGVTETFLRTVAHEYGIYLVAGLATTTSEGKARNQCLVLSPEGRVLVRYDKVHLFTLGNEAEHYVPGNDLVVFDWMGCRIAPFVCYDLRFPELFRAAVAQGAQLFTVIANWPMKREAHWTTLLQARAIENQAYVVGVNRCGTDPKHIYSGRSLIVDPHGAILADAGSRETIVSADVDLGGLETWRKDFPALQDRRWTSPVPVRSGPSFS